MGCVRKRGKSWNTQVRVAGWRSFTKSFARKSDAISWIEEIENELRSSFKSIVNVGKFKDGQRHGQGTLTFADGRKDLGAFKDGDLNGYAI
jgi:hypothetical protein